MEFLVALLLALPAFVANMAPVAVQSLRLCEWLAVPVDGGRKWHGTAILGPHKTWRGFFAAIVAGGLGGLLVHVLTEFSFSGASLAYGMYAGLLAITGDLLKSFFKRRLGRESGRPWLPWDQTDYMILFLIGTYPLIFWDAASALFLLAVAFFGNLATNYLAYTFGLKSTPW